MTTRSDNRLWMVWALTLATISVAVLPALALSCAEPSAGAAGVPSSCASCAMMRRGACGLHPTGNGSRGCVAAHATSEGCDCRLAPIQTLPPAAFEPVVSGADLHNMVALPGSPTVFIPDLTLPGASPPSSLRPHTSDIRSTPPRGPPASFPI